MLRLIRLTAITAVLLLEIFGGRAQGQTPQDVPRDHWSYQAVEDLAARGLVKGYPPDGKFFGKRTVTRYEMASVIFRVMQQLDDIFAKKTDLPKTKSGPAVTPQQLEEVRQLTEEFRSELHIIGADLKRLQEEMGELDARVGAAHRTAVQAGIDAREARKEIATVKDSTNALRRDVGSLQGSVAAATKELDSLSKEQKSHKISGFLQARVEAFDAGRTSLFTPTGAGGTGQTPTNGGASVGGPYYGFLVRRARLKLSGPITARTTYALQIDAPTASGFILKEGYATISDLPFKHVDLTAGTFRTQFGYELAASGAVRESPERALGFSDTLTSSAIFKTAVNATGGVVTPGSVVPLFLNQENDQGIMLTFNAPHLLSPSTKFILSVVNGEGNVVGGIRNLNNGVDLIGRAETSLLNGRLGLGLSGYYGSLPVRGGPPTGTPAAPVAFVNAYRMLAGADVRYLAPWGTSLRVEYVGGVFEASPDRSQYMENNHVQAWYLSARHPLSRKLELVAKYDEYDPITQLGKTSGGLGRAALARRTLSGGVLYFVDDATRLRLWYQRGLTPFDPSATSGPLRSRLGLLTGEVQVSY